MKHKAGYLFIESEKTENLELSKMASETRTFWQVYTPKNIVLELMHKLHLRK
jgi:hypothetical protein